MGVFTIQLQEGDVQNDLFAGDAAEGILFPGNSLYSGGQTFRLLFQKSDGDLLIQAIDDATLVRGTTPASAQTWNTIWSLRGNLDQGPISTGPFAGVARLTMQGDGNLVRNDNNAVVQWASGTQGNPNAFLRMQDDGNLVIYAQGGRAIWATNTFAGPANRPGAGPR